MPKDAASLEKTFTNSHKLQNSRKLPQKFPAILYFGTLTQKLPYICQVGAQWRNSTWFADIIHINAGGKRIAHICHTFPLPSPPSLNCSSFSTAQWWMKILATYLLPSFFSAAINTKLSINYGERREDKYEPCNLVYMYWEINNNMDEVFHSQFSANKAMHETALHIDSFSVGRNWMSAHLTFNKSNWPQVDI